MARRGPDRAPSSAAAVDVPLGANRIRYPRGAADCPYPRLLRGQPFYPENISGNPRYTPGGFPVWQRDRRLPFKGSHFYGLPCFTCGAGEWPTLRIGQFR